MTVKKVESKWLVDLYPNGRGGKRVRKKFDTKLEAQRFEKYVLNAAHSSKVWNRGVQDRRTLKDLIECWYGTNGLHLKDGIRRKRCLNDIAIFSAILSLNL